MIITAFKPALINLQPIIIIGQSNAADGHRSITEYPSRLQYPQITQISCHNLVCYGPATTPVNAPSSDPVWKPISSFKVTAGDMSGIPVGGWALDLADGLRCNGINAALCRYCVGGTLLDYWVPGASGSQYQTIIGWIKNRLNELVSPKEPIVVIYHGESGSTINYNTGLTTLMSGMRTDLGYPNMGFVIVQLPATYIPGSSIASAQSAQVVSDDRSRLAYCHDTTFVNTEPLNLHIDVSSGRRLAIGPNKLLIVRSILTCCKELLV
jgi:hypothetical protein